MRDKNPIRTLEDYSRPSHEGYQNTIELPDGNNVVPLQSDTIRKTAKLHNDILMFPQHQVQIFYDYVNPATRQTIDQSARGKFCDRNAEESWALLEDLALYDNERWNDPRDFAKPVKAISLPQDVPSTSDRHLIELGNQVQCLMEANIAPKSSIQVNKITSLCEIRSSPHNTQYCMENPKQAFVNYASSCIDEVGGKWYTFKPEQNNLGNTYNLSWKGHPNIR
nr:MAK10-like protein [Tanacetum cinerariifolium]